MTAEPTNFLYPFIDSEERDSDSLLVDLAASARAKMDQSRTLQLATLRLWADMVETVGAEMAARFARGGRLYTFGNGGSATDAEMTAEMFRHPATGRPLPAWPLVDDRAVLTALANDVGFELVFSRQLIAHGRADDIAMGLSTSGNSNNVIHAFAEAKRRGMMTIGLAGYEGGAMASSDKVDYCLVVRSDSVHRIQESQDALVFELWTVVQRHLGGVADLPGVPGSAGIAEEAGGAGVNGAAGAAGGAGATGGAGLTGGAVAPDGAGAASGAGAARQEGSPR